MRKSHKTIKSLAGYAKKTLPSDKKDKKKIQSGTKKLIKEEKKQRKESKGVLPNEQLPTTEAECMAYYLLQAVKLYILYQAEDDDEEAEDESEGDDDDSDD